jgi:Mechanosensitive ion channel.
MNQIEELKALLLKSISQFIETASAYIPNLLNAVYLLVMGLLLAWAMKWLIIHLGKGLDRLVHAIGFASLNINIKWPIARVASLVVYWIIILFFVTEALETLGLPAVAEALNRFINHLPAIMIAVVFVLAGVLLGNNLRNRITTGARSTGMHQAEILGGWIRSIIIILAFVAGLAQIGLDVRLFEQILTIFIATLAGAVALSFGLGAGSTVSNIISARYVRSNYRVGQYIQVKDMQGRILEMLPTGVILDTDHGRTFIPAKIFDQEASVLLDNQSSDGN